MTARRAATEHLSMNTKGGAPLAPLPRQASAANRSVAGEAPASRPALDEHHISSAAAPQQKEKKTAHGGSADPRARQGRRPRDGAPPELHHRRGRTPTPKTHQPHHRLLSAAGGNLHTPTLCTRRDPGIPHPPAAGADGGREIPRIRDGESAVRGRFQEIASSAL